MSEDVKVVDTAVNETETTVENQNTEQIVETTPQKQVEKTNIQEAKVEEKDKVFTQAQLDEILLNRLAKERQRMLKKLGVEDETHLDSIVEKSSKFEELQNELDSLRYEQTVNKQKETLINIGADKDFLDFLRLNVVPDEGQEFEEAAKEYLEKHPRFKVETYKNVNSSVNVNQGSSYPDFNQMTPEQYIAWRAKNKL